jgi:hypothetical protein
MERGGALPQPADDALLHPPTAYDARSTENYLCAKRREHRCPSAFTYATAPMN